MQDDDRIDAIKSFPAEDWVPLFRQYLAKDTKYLPPNWLDKISIAAPDAARLREDCKTLRTLKAERPMRLAAIKGQAQGLHEGLLAVLMAGRHFKLDTPATARVLNAANDDLLPVLFYFKTRFNAARPSAYLPDLNPMFAKPDAEFPGHPSYPSGHAAQSRMYALVLSEMLPQLRKQLFDVANDIALNREVAGVHFASDSEAGQRLAEMVFEQLMLNGDFVRLVRLARVEWSDQFPVAP